MLLTIINININNININNFLGVVKVLGPIINFIILMLPAGERMWDLFFTEVLNF